MRFYILLALLIGITGSKIGKKCSYDSACHSSDTSGFGPTAKCIDGVCQCSPGVEVRYRGVSLEPYCDVFETSFKMASGNCNSTSCEPNASCLTIKNKDFIMSHFANKMCYCNEGFLRIGGSCREPNHVSVLQACGGNPVGGTCDLESYSYCSGRLCMCFDTYFANTTSGKCEPMKNYMEAYNLTEYRVKPNEFCAEDGHCISGLVCKTYKCSCPAPCTYNSTEEICDCGSYSVTSDSVVPAIGPIILGIFLSILIMMFWFRKIMQTIEKFDAKKKAGFSNLANSAQNTPSHNTYALDPVRPTNTSSGVTPGPPPGLTVPSPSAGGRKSPLSSDPLLYTPGGDAFGPPAGLTVPSPSTGGRQSPVSSSYLPYKPGGDAFASPPPPAASFYGINPPQAPPSYSVNPGINPPQALPYSINPGINPPQALPYSINPGTPPMYTETPSATDPPPPSYSINPPMGSSSAPLPYPSNPTDSTSALPYPSNPPSPSASPYPLSPSASYPVSPFAPGYPTISGSAPSVIPKQETESYPVTPAYNPSYP